MRFTIYHGLAVSIVLHSLLGVPFVAYSLAAAPDDDSEVLVMDLQGIESDTQTEQKVLAETKGSEKHEDTEQAKPVETPPPPPTDQPADVTEEEPPQQNTNPTPGAENNIKGVNEKQDAHTIKVDHTDVDQLRQYAKALSKKVQAHLVYPDEGRNAGLHGTATVSFTVLDSGQIRPDSLKIVNGSGQAALDASALKTIRASVPFDRPPREMTIAIAVAFGRKS